jgi:hypothetical protein
VILPFCSFITYSLKSALTKSNANQNPIETGGYEEKELDSADWSSTVVIRYTDASSVRDCPSCEVTSHKASSLIAYLSQNCFYRSSGALRISNRKVRNRVCLVSEPNMQTDASSERNYPLFEVSHHTASFPDSLLGLFTWHFTRPPELGVYGSKQLDGPYLNRQSTQHSSGCFLEN